MRGEKRPTGSGAPHRLGSPPHARGKVVFLRLPIKLTRITPACAGKSVLSHVFCLPARDHPRMRGEKGACGKEQGRRIGSPPHARGKGQLIGKVLLCHRITPACAGKRSDIKKALNAVWDHPRMRGEKVEVNSGNYTTIGSPPHARGKGCREAAHYMDYGITPACAGKRRARAHKVHCG